MSFLNTVLMNLPEVQSPLQKKLGFKEKLQWTMITLVAFFLLGLIPLYGLGENSLAQFEFLSIILGASFGSIISLGIGPLVTSSIVLQLLNGSGLVKFDLSSVEGKKRFQGVQKLLSIFFIIFEAGIYVFMGGLVPSALLDPSQFRTSQDAVGKVWVFISSLANQNPTGAILALSSILATILIFFVVVYVQAMKVEIPLSFGRIRGHGIRWPLNFLYTSNIPVILIAALLANVQLWARLLEKWGHPL